MKERWEITTFNRWWWQDSYHPLLHEGRNHYTMGLTLHWQKHWGKQTLGTWTQFLVQLEAVFDDKTAMKKACEANQTFLAGTSGDQQVLQQVQSACLGSWPGCVRSREDLPPWKKCQCLHHQFNLFLRQHSRQIQQLQTIHSEDQSPLGATPRAVQPQEEAHHFSCSSMSCSTSTSTCQMQNSHWSHLQPKQANGPWWHVKEQPLLWMWRVRSFSKGLF